MLSVIKKRRSYRKFLDRPVEKEKLHEILFAAMCAPSAHHKDPWEFITVKDPRTKEMLSEATNYASFVRNAPVIIVITADREIAFRWIEDCSVVAAFIYLEATNQKLGTCWVQIHGMETPTGSDSEEYVRTVLKIPQKQHILCIMPVGYPAEKISEHTDVRFIKTKMHEGTWSPEKEPGTTHQP